jgi:hypothetical protein
MIDEIIFESDVDGVWIVHKNGYYIAEIFISSSYNQFYDYQVNIGKNFYFSHFFKNAKRYIADYFNKNV